MIGFEDLNKSCFSIEAHHPIWEHSLVIHQIIHSFEIDPSWLLNLLNFLLFIFIEVADLWKRLINISQEYRAKRKSWWYATIYANPERSAIFTDLVIHTIFSKKKIIFLFTMFLFVMIRRKLFARKAKVVFLFVRGIISLNDICSIFPLGIVIKLMVLLKIFH